METSRNNNIFEKKNTSDGINSRLGTEKDKAIHTI